MGCTFPCIRAMLDGRAFALNYWYNVLQLNEWLRDHFESTVLLHARHIYRKDRLVAERQSWRCRVRGCPGRVLTDLAQPPRVVEERAMHYHMPDDELFCSRRMKGSLCQLAEDHPLESLSRVYRQANVRPDADEGMLPSFPECRSQMHRARRRNMPALPRTIADIDLPGDWSQTLAGDEFVLHKDARTLILGTAANLELLTQSSVIFMDGTFKAAPRLFTQLFTLHGVFREHVVPLIFCLLPDKQRQTYYDIFGVLKRHLAIDDQELEPPTIISDFESGLIPAVRQQFPATRHRGCFFHHSQAIWKNVQLLGLQGVYNTDPAVRRFIRKLMAVAFLPLYSVRNAYVMLTADPVVQRLAALGQLLQYYKQTWLDGEFRPIMWNVYGETIRTNNRVEGWHNKLNSTIGHLHPNVHRLVATLKSEQAETEATLRRARLGAAPPARRLKYRRLDERLARLKAEFEQGNETTESYLNAVRHIVHHF